jgi:hypothetical protein
MTKSPRENDAKFKRKSIKGKVESADIKRTVNLTSEP